MISFMYSLIISVDGFKLFNYIFFPPFPPLRKVEPNPHQSFIKFRL